MSWLGDHWLALLGWGGSALLVYSLLQSRVLRLRWLNLAACLVLVAYNAAIEVWPMVGMNAALAVINVWYIVRLTRTRHDDTTYRVLEVRPDDAYLWHVLAVHADDITRFQPHFDWSPSTPGALAFLVLKDDETVGVVLLETDEDTAAVKLDYVTPRFRDFSPGEFLWRRSDVLADRGLRRVVTPPDMVSPYYARVGFRRDERRYVLDL